MGWVTELASITCSFFAANAYFGKVGCLHLDLKCELGLPVSTLEGCAGHTLWGDGGTSGRIMCGTVWDLWMLR